jgi:hypothetical protein
MDENDKRMLARKARAVAKETTSHIGPPTPLAHAAAVLAVAQSWNTFADILERELGDPR